MTLPMSAITIVKNRTQQLSSLITQLETSSAKPSELIVVWMSSPSDLSLIQSNHFDVIHKFANQDELPIAKARNKGFREARYNSIVYFAVDAVISPTLIDEGYRALDVNTLVSTTVKLLPIDLCDALASSKSVNASKSQALSKENNLKENHYGKLSYASTCCSAFFIRKTDFENVGGFDEHFQGFGLNDEDFITQCRSSGLALKTISTVTFTPHRRHHHCPTNHLLNYVFNAKRFYRKWGFYPCKEVLSAFASKGLINKDYEHSGLKVTRIPAHSPNEKTTPNADNLLPINSVERLSTANSAKHEAQAHV
jgi:predicted glycosyltransferase involved in capsule biosynthesis